MAKKKDKGDKQPGRFKQIWEVFQMVRKDEPLIVLWFALILLGAIGIAAGVWKATGASMGYLWYGIVLALMVALLGWMILLTRRAEAVAYARIEGRTGATLAGLQQIRRGWAIEEQPVYVDGKTQDMVFRGVGRAGIVLVSEGPPSRVGKPLEKETKRLARILPNVPVTQLQCGREEGQIPLPKLAAKVTRLKPVLTKAETAEVEKRLKALGGMALPIPKGVDPTRVRPDRKGLRGR